MSIINWILKSSFFFLKSTSYVYLGISKFGIACQKQKISFLFTHECYVIFIQHNTIQTLFRQQFLLMRNPFINFRILEFFGGFNFFFFIDLRQKYLWYLINWYIIFVVSDNYIILYSLVDLNLNVIFKYLLLYRTHRLTVSAMDILDLLLSYIFTLRFRQYTKAIVYFGSTATIYKN